MDLNTLKSSIERKLAAEPSRGGRKPTNIDVLLGKLRTHSDLTRFDSDTLDSLTETYGYGNASCEAAVAIYVQQIKKYLAANASAKKVGAAVFCVRLGRLGQCVPLTPAPPRPAEAAAAAQPCARQEDQDHSSRCSYCSRGRSSRCASSPWR
jgi:hypothetical protein